MTKIHFMLLYGTRPNKNFRIEKTNSVVCRKGIAVIRAVNATYIYRMLLYYPFDSLPFFGTLEIYISEVL